jgi:hypothetical protein
VKPMPLNFWLVHDGEFRTTVEVFDDKDNALAHAEAMTAYEGVPWYVGACLLTNAAAYTVQPKKRRTAPKRSRSHG